MSRSRKTDNILQALLTTRTIKEAAESARVSERVIYNYLSDPTFKSLYNAAREDIMRGVSNHLCERMNEAIDVIASIMTDGSRERDKLSAARAILDYGVRYTVAYNILERLQALEGCQRRG